MVLPSRLINSITATVTSSVTSRLFPVKASIAIFPPFLAACPHALRRVAGFAFAVALRAVLNARCLRHPSFRPTPSPSVVRRLRRCAGALRRAHGSVRLAHPSFRPTPALWAVVGFGTVEPYGCASRTRSGRAIPALGPEQSGHVPWTDCPWRRCPRPSVLRTLSFGPPALRAVVVIPPPDTRSSSTPGGYVHRCRSP